MVLAGILVACGTAAPSPSVSQVPATQPASTAPSPTAEATPAIEPAPGSSSELYAPNPAAIVVAIDAGHGGCLDWGVPDPSGRGVELAEKTLTLAIAQRLRDLLRADGIGVLMIRDADVALAGDDYPDLGCTGPAWRDVDGDGESGFEETGRTRTRDELQARIDLANLARADAFISIHINSLTQDGVAFEIAATQTFYDDESAWGAERSAELADGLQAGVVAALEPIASHERQDRGTEAVAYYAISREWRDGDTCETVGDTWCKPHRALAMPGALSEVGSINLRAEHDLLASADGAQAVADGLFDGLRGFFASRRLAARIGLADEVPGAAPAAVGDDGPPFWAPSVADGPIDLRLTNTGMSAWPPDVALVGGTVAIDLPYLAGPPPSLEPLEVDVPALGPGESVVVRVALPAVDAGRALTWIGLTAGGVPLSDLGSPALQLSTAAD